MGRLVAAVIALAVFVTGAMYWSQAEQLSEGDVPLPPEVSIKVATDGCPEGGCAPEAGSTGKVDGGCSAECCKDKKDEAATEATNGKSGCEDGCSGGDKSAEVSNV